MRPRVGFRIRKTDYYCSSFLNFHRVRNNNSHRSLPKRYCVRARNGVAGQVGQVFAASVGTNSAMSTALIISEFCVEDRLKRTYRQSCVRSMSFKQLYVHNIMLLIINNRIPSDTINWI